MAPDRNFRMPSLRSIEAFIWICRLGSFKAASENLNLTVSAISRRIQALEAELGQPLFDRTTRDMRLTEAGARYLEMATPALDQLIAATINFRAGDAQSPLRISVGSAFENQWLAPRLPAFLEQQGHPRVEFVTTNDFRVQVLNVDASIWFSSGDIVPAEAERVAQVDRFPVCHPKLVSSGQLVRPEQLRQQPLIAVTTVPDAWRYWTTAVGLQDLSLRPSLTFDNVDSALQAAAQGLGVALGIDRLCGNYFDRGELIAPFGRDLSSVSIIYLVINPRSASRPLVRAFRSWFIAEAHASLTPA